MKILRARSSPGVALLASALLLPLLCRAQPPSRGHLFDPAPGSPFAVGNGPADVAVGDVNGDGKLDIVTANAGGNSVTILLGDGRGGFRNAPGTPLSAGPKPHRVALGDFDRDGRSDLAVTEHDGNDVRVLLADGRRGFVPAPGSPFPALQGGTPHNHGLAAVDVNGDGLLDLTTANQNDNSVSVLLGDRERGFVQAAGSPFNVGGSPYPQALADLNGDGRPDLVAPNVHGDNLAILLGDGRGGFRHAAGSPRRVASRPYAVALDDFTGDRLTDIVILHDDITLVTVLLGDRKGSFGPAPGAPLDAGYRGGEVVVGDVDGDARKDLVIGADGQRVVVLLGDGRGRFLPAPGSPYAAGRGPWNLALADLNGDGRLDLVTANAESSDVTVLLGRPVVTSKARG